MVKITPSLFQFTTKSELVKAIKASQNADMFHIDVTDGKLVDDPRTVIGSGKSKTGGASYFFDESKLQHVVDVTNVPLDVHLMIADPLDHIERYARFNPLYISFHVEALPNRAYGMEVIEKIRSYGIKPAIVINPQTPPRAIQPYISEVDMVLFMSVIPGQGGQGYIPHVTERIMDLRGRIDSDSLDLLIQVDGGIKLDNIHVPVNAGADVIVSGTGVYGHKSLSPEEVIDKMKNVIVLGSDHGGYKLKNAMKKYFDKKCISYKDLGCYNTDSVDYPDYADKVCEAILDGEYQRGMLFCGTGIGISMRANRYQGIRAALCYDVFTAKMAAEHNNANILAMGGRTTTKNMAKLMFNAWYKTEFAGDRHQRRVKKLDAKLKC